MKILLSILLILSLNSYCQNGKLMSALNIDKLMNTGNIVLKEGTYCLPTNFSKDFTDLTITGVPGKTIITTWDTTSATNFQPKPMDTNLAEPSTDGIYVVSNHPIKEWGGGFAHLKLSAFYNTNGLDVWYIQGTILQRKSGIWSRYYTGYGFKASGNVFVKDIIFDNCQFYLFSPFGQTMSKKFELNNCSFNNVARVISSCAYAGIDHKPDWYNSLNYYNAFGNYRFKEFKIENCSFSNIHTSIVWGFPPSKATFIKDNTISDCTTTVAYFNLFMKNYNDVNYFTDKASQIITGNTFLNCNSSNNFQIQLIRTSGIATISNNNFIDCTPQVALFYGGNTIFSHNNIKKLNTSTEWQSPVVVIKSPLCKNTFTDNIINAPQSIFVALEGASNTNIQGNDLTVKTVYSKADATSGVNQYVNIVNNPFITAGTITNISSRDSLPYFKSVNVSGNGIGNFVYLHTGATKISNYLFERNINIK